MLKVIDILTKSPDISLFVQLIGTIFGIRIRDATPANRPSYGPQKPNILDGVSGLKAGALRSGANALRFKGNVFNSGAELLDSTANGFSPVRQQSGQLRAPGQSSAQLNFLNSIAPGLGSSYNRPSYNPPGNNINNNNVNNNNNSPDVITINNQGPFNSNRDPDVIVGAGVDPRAVDPGDMNKINHSIKLNTRLN